MANSLLALIVAVLAVIVGPVVSLCIARRQIRALAEVADKQITAPMRQAWINKLRELLAELTADTEIARRAGGVGKRSDEDTRHLFLLLDHIDLMLNPNEADHQRLYKLMRALVDELKDGQGTDDELFARRAEVIDLSKKILKHEWRRVKEPIRNDSTN